MIKAKILFFIALFTGIAVAQVSGINPATHPYGNAYSLQGVGISSTTPTSGQIMKYNSTILKWEPAADVGFANPMSASGDIIYGGASGVPTRLAKGSDGQVLTLASGVPSWAAALAIELTALVSDSIAADFPALLLDGTTAEAVAAGGAGIVHKGTSSTGAPFYLTTQDVSANNSLAVNISSGFNSGAGTSGDVNVFSGGATGNTGGLNFWTGPSSGGANGNMVFQTDLGAGTDGVIRFKDGTQGTSGECWVSTDVNGSGNWDTCPGGMTNPMTTGGDLIYGGASGTPTRLANGSAAQYLQSAGGTSAPVWDTLTLNDIGNATSSKAWSNGQFTTTITSSNNTTALFTIDSFSAAQTGASMGVTSTSTSGGTGLSINAAGTSGSNIGLHVQQSVTAQTTGHAIRAQGVSSAGGVKAVVDVRNATAAAANNEAQVIFSANRTTGGQTYIGGFSCGISDIDNTNYKGFCAIQTADGAAPAERMRIDYAGHMEFSGTAPALSTCGTSPSIVGNDNVFTATIGTSASNACTATFDNAWTNTPICVCVDAATGAAETYSAISTTAITFDAAADSQDISCQCVGRR